jgi:hypothetical protein
MTEKVSLTSTMYTVIYQQFQPNIVYARVYARVGDLLMIFASFRKHLNRACRRHAAEQGVEINIWITDPQSTEINDGYRSSPEYLNGTNVATN